MLALEKIVCDLHELYARSLQQDDLKLALSINKILYTIWKDNAHPSADWMNSTDPEPLYNILNFLEAHGQSTTE